MADPFNQVAQGREGTGAAFILSGNRAADTFHQNVAEDEKQKRLLEFQRQKDLRDRRTAIDANLSKLDIKDHWIRHDKELRGQYQSIWDKANALKAAGVDPFLDKDWKDQKNQMDAAATYSKDLSAQHEAFQKEISANRDKYSDESIAEVAAYFDPKKPLATYMAEGMKAPVLKPRYTLSGLLKGVKGSSTEYDGNGRIIKKADRASNVKIAQGMQDTPDYKHFVTQLGGDPNGGAFPVTQQGRTIYSTRDEVLKPMVEKVLEGMDEADLQGRTREEAGAELLDYMKKQNHAHGTVIAKLADHLDAGVDSSSRTDWQATGTPLQWANHALSKSKKDETTKGEEQATFRQDWINAMFDGEPGSGERLQAAMRGNGAYRGELRIQRISNEPSKIVLRLPDKVVETTDEGGEVTSKTVKGRTITLDKNNPDDKVALNQLINEVTKENVNISQLMTPGGKKKVAGGQGSTQIKKPSNDPLDIR